MHVQHLMLASELPPVTGEITPATVTQQRTKDNNEDKNQAAHAIDKDLSTGSLAEPGPPGGQILNHFLLLRKVIIICFND